MPYTKRSYSANSSNIPKYEVSCQAWQFLKASFISLRSYKISYIMCRSLSHFEILELVGTIMSIWIFTLILYIKLSLMAKMWDELKNKTSPRH